MRLDGWIFLKTLLVDVTSFSIFIMMLVSSKHEYEKWSRRHREMPETPETK